MLRGYTAVDDLRERTPRSWETILGEQETGRGTAAANALGLPATSRARRLFGSARTVKLLVPTRERDVNDVALWRLGLECAPTPVAFAPPIARDELRGFPVEFSHCLSALGPFQFGLLEGYILRPDAGIEVAHYLRRCPHTPDSMVTFTPFFDHQNGDYDGWVENGTLPIGRFRHETNQIEVLAAGSFWEWLELTIACRYG